MPTPAKIACGLKGVSETLLLTLYDRAAEAQRPDRVLADPESVRICDMLDYDFAGRFGQPLGAFAARAASIDRILRDWLLRHPDGLVVSLGEGLETQAYRVDNGRMRWLTVDLPAAIALRDDLLPASGRVRHVAASAFDPAWFDTIDTADDVFIVAQGLFMYFEPAAVKQLFIQLTQRFPGAEMAFDVIPRWFSSLTLFGFMQTQQYRLPPMPWGINSDEIGALLHDWSTGIEDLAVIDYRVPRGWPKVADTLCRMNPLTRSHLPCLVHVHVSR